MKKVFFETLVPDELIASVNGRSLVLQPVGSLEWHGPHMGMGMDTSNAMAVAKKVAERLNGIVMPPLYIGTETRRSTEILRKLGFSGDEDITGMDFPENSIKSFYWPPEMFEEIVRTQTEFLVRMGFRQIVWINGHGADAQLEILNRVCKEYSAVSHRSVTTFMTLSPDCGVGIGHAGLAETAIFEYTCPEAVEIDKLPPRSEKLYNTKYAIVDNETFTDGPNDDFSVRYDPRDATPELGKRLVEYSVREWINNINKDYDRYMQGGD